MSRPAPVPDPHNGSTSPSAAFRVTHTTHTVRTRGKGTYDLTGQAEDAVPCRGDSDEMGWMPLPWRHHDVPGS